MTDRPMALVTETHPIAEEGPAEQIRNAMQILAGLRHELTQRTMTGVEVADTLTKAESRLDRALEQLRHQVVVQPISEDPYGPDVKLVKPEPTPIVFGEELED